MSILNSALVREHQNVLSKVYRTYVGSLVEFEYKTEPETAVGGPCIKRTFNYTGTKVIGEIVEEDTWTQTMEDAADGSSLEQPYASIAFDGTNDSILWGAGVYNLTYNQAFSFSLWVKFGTLSNEQCIISCSGTNLGWQITKVNTTNLVRFRMCNTATTNDLLIAGNTALQLSTWHHIAVTINGGTSATTKIYVDGTLQANAITYNNLTTTPSYAGLFMQFGAKGSANFLSGLLDNVLFSNAVLTQDEVTELYNGGTALMPADFSGYASVASAWKLGESADAIGSGGVVDVKGLYNGTMTNMLTTNIVANYPGE